MKFILNFSRLWIAVMVTLVAFYAIGCEPYQAITYDNQTMLPVKVNIYRVSLNYTVIPKRIWNDPGDVIGAGESKNLVTNVPDTRDGGTYYNYAVIGVTETNTIVISKIYTWDQLHDANWIVIITTQ